MSGDKSSGLNFKKQEIEQSPISRFDEAGRIWSVA